MRQGLEKMQSNLDGTLQGDAAQCQAFIEGYESILYNGVFYDEVPADWEEIDLYYVLSFIHSLDRTRPAYLSCKESGKVDNFNYSLAGQAIMNVYNLLNATIAAAEAKLP